MRKAIQDIEMSIRKISAKAREHEDAVRLDIGQPNYDTPEHVKNSIPNELERKQSYAPLQGLPELRKLIAEEESSKEGINIGQEEVAVFTGGCGGIFSVFSARLGSNDTVVLNDPCWGPYKLMSQVNGNKITQVDYWGNDGSLTDKAKGYIKDAALVVVNTPQNPTGKTLTKQQAKEIAEYAEDHDTFLMSDEVYHRLVFDGKHHSPAAFSENSAIIGSVSKNHAMTGWRTGWVVDDPDNLEEYSKISRATVGSSPTLSQQASIQALKNDQHVAKMRESYKERRDLVIELMENQGWKFEVPEGAIYAFPDVGRDSWDFCLEKVEDGVAMVPGESMGPESDTNVRICFGAVNESELRKAFDRL